MNPDEIELEKAAFQFAKSNGEKIAEKIVNADISRADHTPYTVFMAGSPGAGKTEVSKEMVNAIMEKGSQGAGAQKILRIDPDEFRELIPGYTGKNSYLFQKAVSRILEKVLDRAFKKRVSFILDGTMSSLGVATKNIDRALKGGGRVRILYVYQRPSAAVSATMGKAKLLGLDKKIVELTGKNGAPIETSSTVTVDQKALSSVLDCL